MSLDKPLSPHLGVYKMPFLSILSILHRISGLLLSFLFFYIIIDLFILKFDFIHQYIFSYSSFRYFLISLASITFWYHYFNGIKHLFSDCSLFMSLRSSNIGGLIVIASVIIFSVFSFYYLSL
ncbi:MAG: succinate dehydrogenase, cytochrome b556 subunit [Anaplasmataceae bacterium]|nr:succinate dehydrogenase, cytochrome b556 subunit [Anaplasmataceae bacterium]